MTTDHAGSYADAMGRINHLIATNRLVQLLALVLLTAVFMALETWVAWLFPIVVGAIVFALILSQRNLRRSSFALGYFTGRGEMVAALTEASQRGMTLLEWLQGEMEREESYLISLLSKKEKKAFLAKVAALAQQGHDDGGNGNGDHQ